MGQQQLILLVLGIVIVGLAVVVGIQTFGVQKRKADLDLTQTEAVRLATSAAVWRESPAIKGGGLGASSFAGFKLSTLGYEGTTVTDDADSEVVLVSGHFYSVWNRTGQQTHVAVINLEYTVQAAVFLYGNSPECFVMRTGTLDTSTNVWTYLPSETPPRPAGCAW